MSILKSNYLEQFQSEIVLESPEEVLERGLYLNGEETESVSHIAALQCSLHDSNSTA